MSNTLRIERAASSTSSPVLRQKTRILIATAEFPVREAVSQWLAECGYDRTCLDTVNAAWELQQQRAFDVVIADLGLADQSGLELVRQIKQRYPKTAVLILAEKGDSRSAIQALNAGAYAYLSKPFQRQELLSQVERSLERRRLQLDDRERAWQLQKRIEEQTRSVRHAHEETTLRLLKICLMQKGETAGHIKRVGLTSALIAQALGWSHELVELIQLAAQMHDIGQVGIPDYIFQKTGRLSQREFEIMQWHTTMGGRLLSGSLSPVLQMAEQIARCHHERWDGTGYPARLVGQHIPTAARIVAIADVYDALTHDRVFRRAFPEDEVQEMMNDGIGSQFDPTVAYAFFDALPAIQVVNVLADSEPVTTSARLER